MIVDFHSHILPGIDDGSPDLKTSIAMLKMEAEQGIGHVVATPHFYAHHESPDRFLEKRNEAELRLREEMAKYEGLPRLSIGAEVYFFPGISDSDILSELTIDKNECILLEMPLSPWTDRMYREIEHIYARSGIIPIMAHVDRYITPFQTHGIPERLEQLPVMVQANASFFLRFSTRGMALRMLRQDRIHLLGSDCHNLTDRAPNLGSAVSLIRQRLGTEALAQIALNQESLLTDGL